MIDVRLAVLEFLLDHHPGLLSTEEVIRALTSGVETFPERDKIEVAVRELVEAGLANRLGSFVFASHAAAQFEALSRS